METQFLMLLVDQFGKFQNISSWFDLENPPMDVRNDSVRVTHINGQWVQFLVAVTVILRFDLWQIHGETFAILESLLWLKMITRVKYAKFIIIIILIIFYFPLKNYKIDQDEAESNTFNQNLMKLKVVIL